MSVLSVSLRHSVSFRLDGVSVCWRVFEFVGGEGDNISNIVAISWLSLLSIAIGDEKFLVACCILWVPWRTIGVAADWRIALVVTLDIVLNAVLVNVMIVVLVCFYFEFCELWCDANCQKAFAHVILAVSVCNLGVCNFTSFGTKVNEEDELQPISAAKIAQTSTPWLILIGFFSDFEWRLLNSQKGVRMTSCRGDVLAKFARLENAQRTIRQ